MAAPDVSTEVRAHPHDHLVGFYGSDEYLTDSVVRYIAPALDGDGVALVLGTADHLAEIRTGLEARGYDPDTDRYVPLDAHETLEAISRDGEVDPQLFRRVIGGAIDAVATEGRRVYAFGELVAILWDRGDVAGALLLESLWNELATTRPFSLFCGYPTSAFADAQDTTAFRTVCDAHSAVIPSEDYSDLLDPGERRRAVAILEQEAIARANERDALRERQAGLEAALDARTQADRLQRQFTAMLVHDLRSPTVVVSGLLTLLERNWDDLNSAEIRDNLATAAASAHRMERLIDDMLAMAQLESGRFRYDLTDLDLAEVVRTVAADVGKTTGRDIEVRLPDRIRRAHADSGRQLQVLDNLLSNAVKFSSDESPVRVTLEDRGGDLLHVHVEDVGIGIAQDDLDKLFQPFSRVGRNPGGAKGTGLGLFIARSLVEGQGGTIDVSSTPGAGTRFTYTVPVAAHR